jgi:hypothetical protein
MLALKQHRKPIVDGDQIIKEWRKDPYVPFLMLDLLMPYF